MKLVLDADVVRDVPADVFVAGAQTRGFVGFEVPWTTADTPPSRATADLARRIREAGGDVVAIRALDAGSLENPELLRFARRAALPVIVPPALMQNVALDELLARFERAEVAVRLGVSREAPDTVAYVETQRRGVGIAWHITAGVPNEAADVKSALRGMGNRLEDVHLAGGGPESDLGGVGLLFAALALSGFDGTVTLSPSREARRQLWVDWIRGGSAVATNEREADTRRRDLDVRGIEPRDRLHTILSAYASVDSGGALTLTVDHDPLCMYYTLQAQEPKGSFGFEYLEKGPDVWRVRVEKHGSRPDAAALART